MKPLLILGKSYSPERPEVVGGVIVLHELFKSELAQQNVRFNHVDLNARNYKIPLFAPFSISLRTLFKAPNCRYIFLNATAHELVIYGLIVTMIAKLFRKKVALRKFAGSFREYYEESTKPRRLIIDFVLKQADLLFFETKYLVEHFQHFNPQTHWFPNVRKASNIQRKSTRPFEKKFVFFGHVRSEKGIDDIVAASQLLSPGYSIDIYGPLFSDHYDVSFFESVPNVEYRGVVSAHQVASIMTEYDVLVLPTFWKGEGYPGVIIEAFSVGLPVVATNLPGISEMIDSQSGILVPPHSASTLAKAIEVFTNENYAAFSKGASQRFNSFDSGQITAKVVKQLER